MVLPPKDFIGSMSPNQPHQAESPRNDSIGSMAPNQPNQAAPPPSSDSTNAPAPGQSSAAQPPTDYTADRQSDKVKALKLQDGDITTQ